MCGCLLMSMEPTLTSWPQQRPGFPLLQPLRRVMWRRLLQRLVLVLVCMSAAAAADLIDYLSTATLTIHHPVHR